MTSKLGELLERCEFRNDRKPGSSELNDYIARVYTAETYDVGARVYVLAEYDKPATAETWLLLQPATTKHSAWRATVPARFVKIFSPLELLALEAE